MNKLNEHFAFTDSGLVYLAESQTSLDSVPVFSVHSCRFRNSRPCSILLHSFEGDAHLFVGFSEPLSCIRRYRLQSCLRPPAVTLPPPVRILHNCSASSMAVVHRGQRSFLICGGGDSPAKLFSLDHPDRPPTIIADSPRCNTSTSITSLLSSPFVGIVGYRRDRRRSSSVLQVYDLRDPSEPELTKSFTIPGVLKSVVSAESRKTDGPHGWVMLVPPTTDADEDEDGRYIIPTIDLTRVPTSMASAADGSEVLVGFEDGTVGLLDWRDCSCRYSPPASQVRSLPIDRLIALSDHRFVAISNALGDRGNAATFLYNSSRFTLQHCLFNRASPLGAKTIPFPSPVTHGANSIQHSSSPPDLAPDLAEGRFVVCAIPMSTIGKDSLPHVTRALQQYLLQLGVDDPDLRSPPSRYHPSFFSFLCSVTVACTITRTQAESNDVGLVGVATFNIKIRFAFRMVSSSVDTSNTSFLLTPTSSLAQTPFASFLDESMFCSDDPSEVLGKGGSSIVYPIGFAEEEDDDQRKRFVVEDDDPEKLICLSAPLALKVETISFPSRFVDTIDRIDLLRRFMDSHPHRNLCRVFGWTLPSSRLAPFLANEKDDDCIGVVMERCPMDILSYLKPLHQAALTGNEKEMAEYRLLKVSLLCQLARAIVHLHSNGIVHGDIKLRNVLMGSDGRLKLADFGFISNVDNDDVGVVVVSSSRIQLGGSTASRRRPSDSRGAKRSDSSLMIRLSSASLRREHSSSRSDRESSASLKTRVGHRAAAWPGGTRGYVPPHLRPGCSYYHPTTCDRRRLDIYAFGIVVHHLWRLVLPTFDDNCFMSFPRFQWDERGLDGVTEYLVSRLCFYCCHDSVNQQTDSMLDVLGYLSWLKDILLVESSSFDNLGVIQLLCSKAPSLLDVQRQILLPEEEEERGGKRVVQKKSWGLNVHPVLSAFCADEGNGIVVADHQGISLIHLECDSFPRIELRLCETSEGLLCLRIVSQVAAENRDLHFDCSGDRLALVCRMLSLIWSLNERRKEEEEGEGPLDAPLPLNSFSFLNTPSSPFGRWLEEHAFDSLLAKFLDLEVDSLAVLRMILADEGMRDEVLGELFGSSLKERIRRKKFLSLVEADELD